MVAHHADRASLSYTIATPAKEQIGCGHRIWQLQLAGGSIQPARRIGFRF
jgi:hypothetical protein